MNMTGRFIQVRGGIDEGYVLRRVPIMRRFLDQQFRFLLNLLGHIVDSTVLIAAGGSSN